MTLENGQVVTYDTNGNSKRRICESAIEARWQDGNILVRTKTGNRIVDTLGNTLRVL